MIGSQNKLICEFPRHWNKPDIKSIMNSMYGLEAKRISTYVKARTRKIHPLNERMQNLAPTRQVYQWATMRKRAVITLTDASLSNDSIKFPPVPEPVLDKSGYSQEEEKKAKREEHRYEQIEKFRRKDQWTKVLRERYNVDSTNLPDETNKAAKTQSQSLPKLLDLDLDCWQERRRKRREKLINNRHFMSMKIPRHILKR